MTIDLVLKVGEKYPISFILPSTNTKCDGWLEIEESTEIYVYGATNLNKQDDIEDLLNNKRMKVILGAIHNYKLRMNDCLLYEYSISDYGRIEFTIKVINILVSHRNIDRKEMNVVEWTITGKYLLYIFNSEILKKVETMMAINVPAVDIFNQVNGLLLSEFAYADARVYVYCRPSIYKQNNRDIIDLKGEMTFLLNNEVVYNEYEFIYYEPIIKFMYYNSQSRLKIQKIGLIIKNDNLADFVDMYVSMPEGETSNLHFNPLMPLDTIKFDFKKWFKVYVENQYVYESYIDTYSNIAIYGQIASILLSLEKMAKGIPNIYLGNRKNHDLDMYNKIINILEGDQKEWFKDKRPAFVIKPKIWKIYRKIGEIESKISDKLVNNAEIYADNLHEIRNKLAHGDIDYDDIVFDDINYIYYVIFRVKIAIDILTMMKLGISYDIIRERLINVGKIPAVEQLRAEIDAPF